MSKDSGASNKRPLNDDDDGRAGKRTAPEPVEVFLPEELRSEIAALVYGEGNSKKDEGRMIDADDVVQRKATQEKIRGLSAQINERYKEFGLKAQDSTDSLIVDFKKFQTNNRISITRAQESIFRQKLKDEISDPKNPFTDPIVFRDRQLHTYTVLEADRWGTEEFNEIIDLMRDYVVYDFALGAGVKLPEDAQTVSVAILNLLRTIPQEKLTEDRKELLKLAKSKFDDWKKAPARWSRKKAKLARTVQGGEEPSIEDNQLS